MDFSGLVILDKPQGQSSFSVLGALKKRLGLRKAGYLGTLDPMATGVLVCFFGDGTKLIRYFEGVDKDYEVEFVLGKSSDTYDSTGTVIDTVFDFSTLPEGDIASAVQLKTGKMRQIQPQFSAVRVQGRRAYELAREGLKFDIGKRDVEIFFVDDVEIDCEFVSCRLSCSSGTYIRSWVHELGEELGCGAIMTGLRRTRVGLFCLSEAVSLDTVTEADCFFVDEIKERWLKGIKL
jgi:tRNA pseudouridine55 synthase